MPSQAQEEPHRLPIRHKQDQVCRSLVRYKENQRHKACTFTIFNNTAKEFIMSDKLTIDVLLILKVQEIFFFRRHNI
jgi:hypothetical protein